MADNVAQGENETGEVAEAVDPMAAIDMVHILTSQSVYDDIVKPFPVTLGKAASKRERDMMKTKAPTLVYGEIDFMTFGRIMEKIKKIYGLPDVGTSGPMGILQRSGGVFYDLGAGVGKPVIAAAILHSFDACIGIELLESLHNLSLELLFAYNSKGKAKGLDAQCQFLRGDFLDTNVKDWRDADVVFINSTCFDEPLMDKLARASFRLKKGAFVVSISRRLPTTELTVLEHELCPMSWGEATVFIQQKITEPREPPEIPA